MKTCREISQKNLERSKPAQALRDFSEACKATGLFFPIVFLLTVVGSTVVAGGLQSRPQVGPPNIILILTDDQDAASIDSMPILQSLLADEGTNFSNCCVNVSLCCPSRATILLGQNAHNHQVLTNMPPNGGFERFYNLGHESSTIATWLQAAGYRTALFGKYLNGYPNPKPSTYIPPGWTEWYGVVGDRHYFDYQINENGKVVFYGADSTDYETDVLSRKATEFIRQNPSDTPFFIYLAPFAPHSPTIPAPRHASEFDSANAPHPPSFNEEDVTDKPQWVQKLPLLTNSVIGEIDAHYRNSLRSLLAVDEMIQSIIDTLRSANQLDNTYIFYTSDHGFHKGEHRLPNGKQTPYEETVRVPLIVRGPGVPAAQALGHLTSNTDLAPTFLELAGTGTSALVDGRSLVPLLGNPPPGYWRVGLIVEHWQENTTIPDYQGLRTSEYQYTEYVTSEREFYDLRTDPYQIESSPDSVDPSIPALLEVLRDCAGEDCFPITFEEVPAPPIPLFPPDSATGISTSPTMTWSPSLGSESYSLQVSDTSDFSSLIVDADSLLETSFDVTGLSNSVTYFWRVSATNDLGTSDWSEAWSFTTLATSVDDDKQLPTEFSLSQNYPNPFNPSTVIRYGLPEKAHVRLEVFNVLGQRVALLVDAERDAGYHEQVLVGQTFSSGIYFYKVTADRFAETRRLVILR